MRARRQIERVVLAAIALLAVLPPAGAGAARVINGGFESGTLNGWQVQQEIGSGNWFAYTGTAAPIGSKRPTPADPVQAPPQGAYAATTDEANPDSLILYQDVALEPGLEHRLSLLAFYDTYRPVAVPTPDTLSIDEEGLLLPNGKTQSNQQFRVDVVRPEAPLDSLDPADVLRTVFATRQGDPPRMTPRRLSADLTPFAGQTVRIRIANAVTDEVFNAGVDAVSINSAPPGGLLPQGSKRGGAGFRFGLARANRRSGIVTVRVSVVEPGLLRAAPDPAHRRDASTGGRGDGSIVPVTIPIGSARTVTLRIRPTAASRAVLRRRHRLRASVGLTYMPAGRFAERAPLPVTFLLASRARH
jgi:hypothetical protein